MTEPVTTQTVLIRNSIKAMLDGDGYLVRYELDYLARHGVPVFDLVWELLEQLAEHQPEYIYLDEDGEEVV
jgi:hypothetical protein